MSKFERPMNLTFFQFHSFVSAIIYCCTDFMLLFLFLFCRRKHGFTCEKQKQQIKSNFQLIKHWSLKSKFLFVVCFYIEVHPSHEWFCRTFQFVLFYIFLILIQQKHETHIRFDLISFSLSIYERKNPHAWLPCML